MTNQTIEWLRGLAAKGGRGVVNNIDARCLGRIATEIEDLHFELKAARNQIEIGDGEIERLKALPSHEAGTQGLLEATAAQHFDLPKGQPAKFVRNGVLETCQCRECAPKAGTQDETEYDAIAKSWGWFQLKRGWYHVNAQSYDQTPFAFPLCYRTAKELCEKEGLRTLSPIVGCYSTERADSVSWSNPPRSLRRTARPRNEAADLQNN